MSQRRHVASKAVLTLSPREVIIYPEFNQGADRNTTKQVSEDHSITVSQKGLERAILVGVHLPDSALDMDASLEELSALADTAGACIVHRLIQRRESPNPAFLIGKGKVAELAEFCQEKNADLVVFDHDLTPAQVRNLERETKVRVIDRTEIILDIFARRARSKQAKLQVELAQLQYELPRLRRMWTHLSRIEGGIGLRGPGETQIEVDRRKARDRISDLQKALKQIEKRKSLETASRSEFFTVALVGYTNVGKTALMNALTGEALFTENRLFATLDATTRSLQLPGGQTALLTDTVGFIQKLPHHLVASFHATLEEVREADLLLHVSDVSHADRRGQVVAVQRVLREMGCAEKPVIYVFNKCDLIDDQTVAEDLEQFEAAIMVSAIKNKGLEQLRSMIEVAAQSSQVEIDVRLPASDGRVAAYIAEHGNVLLREYDHEHVHLRARMHPGHAARVHEWVNGVES